MATPVVFNNELYVFDFDHTIGTEIQALSGVLGAAIGMDVKASDYLRPMYTTLRHTQGLWKLNNDTGVFEKVEAFSEIFKNTTVEYVWRAEVYNDNLYITTMDSAVLYNYITKLTNGSFVKMSSEEWKDLISNVTKLSLILKPEMGKKAAQIRETIDQVTAKLKELQAKLAESGDVQTFIEELNAAMSELKAALAEARIVLAENQLVQQIMAQVKSQALVAQDQLKAVKAQVAAFIADFDLFKFIAPDLDVPISTLSDEELDELMDTLKTKLLTVIEKMKVEIPELKPIDIEAVKMAIADFAARAIDKTIGQKLYEAILNLNAAFEERVTELTNKTVTDISEIIKSKLLAIAEKLPEDKQAIIQKLTELSVKNLIDSIVEEYSEKLMEAEEKIKALKSMTIGDYQTYADSMIDMMANAAIKQLTAVNEKLKSYGFTKTDSIMEEATAIIMAKGENVKAEVDRFFDNNFTDEEKELTLDQYSQMKVEKAVAALDAKLNRYYYMAMNVFEKIDWEGLKMYAYISDMVKNDTWGFDMVRTSDGENFELVTDDGFGDKYNYGGRSMTATPYGLYIGTANPFYGAQLYRLNDSPATDKLKDQSALESDTISLGNNATVILDAKGGTGTYRYSVLYKKATSSKWSYAAKNTTDTSASFKPAAGGKYDVRVIAKDTNGNVAKTKLVLNVNSELTNTSKLSAEEIALGEKVKIRASAKGGAGSYQYAVFYKKAASSNWIKIHDYSENYAFGIKPNAATDYEFRVDVMDADDTVVSKTFNLKVVK